MNLKNFIIKRLEKSMLRYDDLVELLPEETLVKDLAGLPSNKIGEQLWCVIGARESYVKAIEKGEWVGFDCSLKRENTRKKAEVSECLRSSRQLVLNSLEGIDWVDDENRREKVVSLLEHEAMHQGQLIRYLYGLKLEIPVSWKKRYDLD